jgi:PhnB protein
MAVKLLPYLNFNRETKPAMEFYHSVFGGELHMSSFGESNMPVKDDEKELIVHAELKTDEFNFMSSDGGVMHPVHMGDNIHMSLIGEDEAKLTEYFNKLAEGGTVDMPLQKQFWGDTYGQLTDKFGVHWMVNIGPAKPPQK